MTILRSARMLEEGPAFEAFLSARPGGGGRLVLLTTAAETDLWRFAFETGDTPLMGRESAGVPEPVHAAADARVRIPMRAGLRSLNVPVAAAMALGEAMRQCRHQALGIRQ